MSFMYFLSNDLELRNLGGFLLENSFLEGSRTGSYHMKLKEIKVETRFATALGTEYGHLNF